MFYSKSLLSRKGPLGNIWVAAYFFKKLKKEQVTETNISSTIDKIIPDVQLSYRVLAYLLLGVVRIFSKKVDYLFHDCNEVLIRLGKTFLTSQRTTSKEATEVHHHKVSLPKEATGGQFNSDMLREESIHISTETVHGAYHDIAITLPKNFALDSFDLGIPEDDENVSNRQQFRLEVEDELEQPAFMNERHYDNMIARSDFYSGCFTPVEDVISSGILDIDMEVSKLQQESKSRSREKQKLEGDLPPLEECANHSHARRSLKLSMHPQGLEEPKGRQQTNLSDPSHASPGGHAEVRTPVKDYSKMRLLCTSEAASPEFAVTTPAIKERPLMLRKRKCPFDETIVLSNQILRQWIHDASSLICKRRKAPCTFLAAWKVQKLLNLENSLLQPLIPLGIPFDFNTTSLESSYVPSLQKKSADTTDKSDLERTAVLGEPAEPEQRDGLLERPSIDLLTSVSCAEVPSAGQVNEEIFEEPFSVEKSGSDISLIDREFSSIEEESDNQDGWSTRTRLVARLFSRCLEQEGKGALSLPKLLEGKSRTKCAKLFYETLVLKTRGYVGVEQESPYGDIIVSATPAMKTMFESNDGRETSGT